MSGGIAQELQRNPVAMQQIAPLIQSAMFQMPQMQQQMPQQMQQMPQQMQQPMGMTPMGYDPMLAIAQMQRQPMQQVQNPIFGGAIPMDFGLPQASQVPIGYQSAMAQYRPSPFIRPPVPDPYQNSRNRNRNYYNNFDDNVGSGGSEGEGDGNASAGDMGGEDV